MLSLLEIRTFDTRGGKPIQGEGGFPDLPGTCQKDHFPRCDFGVKKVLTDDSFHADHFTYTLK